MNIDPRTLKELLQLQMLNKMDLITGNPSANGPEGDNDFSELLTALMEQAGGSQPSAGAVPNTLNAKPAMKPLSFGPAAYRRPSTVGGQMDTAANPSQFDSLIMEASRSNGIEPSLVKAVIDAESSFQSDAVSKAGAKGLMQLMDATGRELGVADPFDPVQNIRGGTRYLSDLIRKYNGNEGVALAAYNAGSGRLSRLGISDDNELMEKLHLLPKETQNYVHKVMGLQRNYEA